jgi:hypothetical protein
VLGASDPAPWEGADNWPFGWVPLLVDKLRERGLPKLETPDLWVASDYSGAQRGSRFMMLGVLIGDAGHSEEWELRRREIRKQYLPDGRRMSFKGLNDSKRRAALIPFLDAADAIRGISFVLAVDKRLRNFGGHEDLQQRLKELGVVSGSWKPHTFDRMIVQTHLISILLSLVTREGQSITWISDADDSFATDAHKKDTAGMMGRFSSLYIHHRLGRLSVGTTDLDEGDRFEEDFAAIPDLAAGAVGELFEKTCIGLGKIPSIASLAPQSLSRKSNLITSWFFHPNTKHAKIACVIQKISEGHLQIGTIWEDDTFGSSMLSTI